jgi:putative aldouronate transport system permease protein
MAVKWAKTTLEDKIVDVVIFLFCTLVLFATMYPFYFILIVSLNEGLDAAIGGIYWFPRTFTLENYEQFFSDTRWLRAIGVSVARTAVGTGFGVLFTTIVSYGLSFKDLAGRKFYMVFIIISMYFSGGIIPYFILLRELNLLNTFAVYVIPGAVSAFFLLIGISFFGNIPPSLRESAKMDGAGEVMIFTRIILMISKPFIATTTLFMGVGHWNNWFDNAFFIRDRSLDTLPFLMMQVVNSAQVTAVDAMHVSAGATTPLSVQAAAMIIATVPIICVYPFLQKYFVSGIMIGSVKE